jgi:hypothetical protein
VPSQIEGNIMARSSRPDDDNLLSNISLCSCVLEGVDDLPLELCLETAANQLRVLEHG